MKKLLYVLLICAGCKSSSTTDARFESLNTALENTLTDSQLEKSTHCIIIPKSGCGGCIDEAILFLKPRIDSLKNVEIVFSGIADRKLLKLVVGEAFLQKANVHIDSLNHFQDLKLLSVYPQLVTLTDGKATSLKELDSHSAELTALLKSEKK